MKVRGIAIDNGGSEVRIESGEKVLTTLKNDFVTIEESNFREKETEDPFELCRVLSAPAPFYEGIVARGATGRRYESQHMVIDSQSPKTGSINYYRQLIFAIAQDAIKAKRTETGPVKFDTIDYVYAIASCLPIKEYSGKYDCASKLKHDLKGTYLVEFPLVKNGLNRVKFEIKEKFFGVLPEGGVVISAFKDKISEDEISVVGDLGHITFDLAVFQGTSLYGDKVISAHSAGSTLIALTRSALADEGYYLTDDQTVAAIKSGVVKQGAKEVDVTETIEAQKEVYVKNYLRNEIIQLLNMNHLNASQVTNFVPIGDGMNNPEAEGGVARRLVDCVGFENARILVASDNLRYANVECAWKFAKVLASAASKTLKLEVSK